MLLLLGLAGVAIFDPPLASGLARISFALTAVIGLGLIIFLSFKAYDRAIMLIPRSDVRLLADSVPARGGPD